MNALEGAAERERRSIEKIVAQAWWNAALEGAGEKLKPMKHYLDALKPKKPQTADEILAVFNEFKARGAPVSIKRFGPDGKELN